MIDYRITKRLQYIPGGLNVQMSAWPSGSDWWVPTTGSATCVAAYQPKGAASLAASYVNLANPGTYDLTEGVAPTFDAATGWAFDATTTYLKTGIVPTSYSWSYIVRFSDAGTQIRSAAYMIGSLNATNSKGVGLSPKFSALGNKRLYTNGGYVTGSTFSSDGIMAVAAGDGYLNGIGEGSFSPGSYELMAAFYIGARNDNPFGDSLAMNATGWVGKIQALAIYSTTLDATQVGEITTAMNAL